MSSHLNRYSKISPALKFQFIENLYWRDMSIKEAAERCNLNYSTGKIILNSLSEQEKIYISNLKRKKRRCTQAGELPEIRCGYQCIPEEQLQRNPIKRVQVFSRVGFNYFQGKRPKKRKVNIEQNTINDIHPQILISNQKRT